MTDKTQQEIMKEEAATILQQALDGLDSSETEVRLVEYDHDVQTAFVRGVASEFFHRGTTVTVSAITPDGKEITVTVDDAPSY